jgi:hypothetical protein
MNSFDHDSRDVRKAHIVTVSFVRKMYPMSTHGRLRYFYKAAKIRRQGITARGFTLTRYMHRIASGLS